MKKALFILISIFLIACAGVRIDYYIVKSESISINTDIHSKTYYYTLVNTKNPNIILKCTYEYKKYNVKDTIQIKSKR